MPVHHNSSLQISNSKRDETGGEEEEKKKKYCKLSKIFPHSHYFGDFPNGHLVVLRKHKTAPRISLLQVTSAHPSRNTLVFSPFMPHVPLRKKHSLGQPASLQHLFNKLFPNVILNCTNLAGIHSADKRFGNEVSKNIRWTELLNSTLQKCNPFF